MHAGHGFIILLLALIVGALYLVHKELCGIRRALDPSYRDDYRGVQVQSQPTAGKPDASSYSSFGAQTPTVTL